MKIKNQTLVDISDPKDSQTGRGGVYCDVSFQDPYGNKSVVYVEEGMRNFTNWYNWCQQNYQDRTTEWDLVALTRAGSARLNKRKQTICNADHIPVPTAVAPSSSGLFQFGS